MGIVNSAWNLHIILLNDSTVDFRANMLKQKTIPILVCVVICVVGPLFMSGGVSKAGEDAVAAGEPNLVRTTEGFNFDKLDFSTGDSGDRNKLMKQFGYAIFLVMILGVGAFYFTRKLVPRLSMQRGKNISVIETVSLGPNKMLHLVEVGDNHRLLVGSTNQSINLLTHVSGSVFEQISASVEED